MILVIAEQRDGKLNRASLEAVAAAQAVAVAQRAVEQLADREAQHVGRQRELHALRRRAEVDADRMLRDITLAWWPAAAIAAALPEDWRLEQARARTDQMRPDLA